MNTLPTPTALGRAAAAVRPFRAGGRTQLAVVVKATFQIVARGLMTPLPPLPVVASDQRAGADPRAPLLQASEMAPYLANAGVLLTGHACARGRVPAPSVAVRLCAGLGSRALVNKTLHVYGDRAAGGHGAPRPFLTMPLSYERAVGGAADPDNPAGADPRTGRLPNIIDPQHPTRAAGFGPIAPQWPARARLLHNVDSSGVLAPWPVLPDGFDWGYFQAAPPDQQTPPLQGREWIVLEGLHPDVPRFEATLPGPVAEARIQLPGAGEPVPLRLVADMLVIDADHLVCCLVWRASTALPSEAIAGARVTAKVALPGEEVAWESVGRALPFRPGPPAPERRPEKPPSGAPSPAPSRKSTSPTTLSIPAVSAAATGQVLPFAQPAAPAPMPSAAPPPEETLDDERTVDLPFAALNDGSPAVPPPRTPVTAGLPFVQAAAAPLVAPPAPPLPRATPWVEAGTPQVAPAAPQVAPAAPPVAPATPPVAPATPPVEPASPWASGSAHAARPSFLIGTTSDVPPHPAASPAPTAPAAASARPVAPRPTRARRPRLLPSERPSSAPLVPPRKRRPSRVAAGGLGASFLRSAAPPAPTAPADR